jgi:hypothetical protein
MNTVVVANLDHTPLTEEQCSGFIKSCLAIMEVNPNTSGSVRFDYADESGARGALPQWNAVPNPVERISTLIGGPMGIPGKVCYSALMEVPVEEVHDWVCLTRPTWGSDGSCGEFFTINHKTWTDAKLEASRYLHGNDATAYRLVQASRMMEWVEQN